MRIFLNEVLRILMAGLLLAGVLALAFLFVRVVAIAWKGVPYATKS